MNVLFCPVPPTGGPAPAQGSDLRLRLGEIAGYVLMDWLPWSTPLRSMGVMRWMRNLLYREQIDGRTHWVLQERLGTTERHWKRLFSATFGIIGARHFLAHDGYRWVAPVSAFFGPHPRRIPVCTGMWPHLEYGPGLLEATRPTPATGRLTPDYLAIRQRRQGGRRFFAAVEAKGTAEAIGGQNRTCPQDWYDQARYLVLTHEGRNLGPWRPIVVATRVNPNSTDSVQRRIEMRAWNAAPKTPLIPPGAAVEIVAAHLFGLCVNLGLYQNAHLISQAVAGRASQAVNTRRPADVALRVTDMTADEELRRITGAEIREDGTVSTGRVTLDGLPGEIAIEVDTATMTLLRRLRTTNVAAAVAALNTADDQLDRLEAAPDGKDAGVLLSAGLRVRMEETDADVEMRPDTRKR